MAFLGSWTSTGRHDVDAALVLRPSREVVLAKPFCLSMKPGQSSKRESLLVPLTTGTPARTPTRVPWKTEELGPIDETRSP